MALILAFISAGPFLARIDPSNIGAEGIDVLYCSDNLAIARIDGPMEGAELLTIYHSEKTYLWVRPLHGSLISNLTDVGRIIFTHGNDFLIETDEATIEQLDLRHLMIARLRRTPIRLRSKPEMRKTPTFDPLVQQMVDAVDSMQIIDYVRTLQNGFFSRHSRTTGCSLAVAYVRDHFENLGYDSVYYHKYLSNYAPNVWAVKRGKQDDSTYVICGHIDAVISTGPIAYGADDNASGSACVMEAARVMAGYEFKHRVVFICFTGEEQGLYGSYYWCNAHQNDPMYGALNFDMIGWMDRPDRVAVISDYQSVWLMNFVDSCGSYYLPGFDINAYVDPSARYSDHASFWNIGVAALCHIEDGNGWNPYYHTRGDTIGAGFNDLTFCWKNVKLGVASLASLAEPIGPKASETEKPVVERRRFPTIAYRFLIIPEGLKLTIYDASGRKIMIKDKKRISLSGGIYFIEYTGKEDGLEKVVVIR